MKNFVKRSMCIITKLFNSINITISLMQLKQLSINKNIDF